MKSRLVVQDVPMMDVSSLKCFEFCLSDRILKGIIILCRYYSIEDASKERYCGFGSVHSGRSNRSGRSESGSSFSE